MPKMLSSASTNITLVLIGKSLIHILVFAWSTVIATLLMGAFSCADTKLAKSDTEINKKQHKKRLKKVGSLFMNWLVVLLLNQ
jgi:hypothetical protein